MKTNESFREFKKRIRNKDLYISYESIKKLKELYKDLILIDEKIGLDKRASLFIMREKIRRMRKQSIKNRIRNIGKFFKAFKTSKFVGKWYRLPCYIYAVWIETTVIGWKINQLPYKLKQIPDKIREKWIVKIHRCDHITDEGYRCKGNCEYFLRDDNGERIGYFCYNCYQDIAQAYWESAYDL